MPQQSARPSIRAGQALGLAVFLATAAFLAAILVDLIIKWPSTLQEATVVLASACALVAAAGILFYGIDLWLRGRRMSPQQVTTIRAVVFAAVIGALAASMVGKSTAVVLSLMPAMFIYLFISRGRPAPATAGGARRGSAGGRSGGSSSGTTKSRQRKGGKKHR